MTEISVDKIADSTVESYMSDDLWTLEPEDALLEALMLVCSRDIRHVPICEAGQLVGIISDRDIKRALPTRKDFSGASAWEALSESKCSEVMQRQVRVIDPQTTLRDAARILMETKISALPILRDEKLCGIITTEDILWAFIGD